MKKLDATLSIYLFLLLLALALFATKPAHAFESPIRNLPAVIDELNLRPYFSDSAPTARRLVKIAILDNGFRGFRNEFGRSLPATTVYHHGPIPPPEDEEMHGLAMAQIVSGLLSNGGRSTRIPFELHLFSAFGYTNLQAAIEQIIADDFDVVLYSQVWEYGGNGDGRGFINSLVNRATDAGALWINAAGNFETKLHQAQVRKGPDDWAILPGPNQSVRIRCQANQENKCHLRLVLSWNDFKDDVNLGTVKDLDLVLTDDTLKIVRTSGLAQKAETQDGAPGASKYPREIIQAELEPGLYYARVKIRSRNFGPSDRLTLAASGDFIEMPDATEGESLFAPADNPRVVTVGASDSANSSLSRKLGKPELVTPSLIELDADLRFKGSSNSAAIAAAAAAVLRAHLPGLRRGEFLRIVSGRPASIDKNRYPRAPGRTRLPSPPDTGSSGYGEGRGYPMQIVRFGPTGPSCFEDASLAAIYPHLQPLLQNGARPVYSTQGIKIIVATDPVRLISGLYRRLPSDMVVVDQNGYALLSREWQPQLSPNTYEIVELPLGQRFCGRGTESNRDPEPRRPSDYDAAEAPIHGVGRRLRLPDPRQL